MMEAYRLNKFKGTPREIGIAIGESIGDRFVENVDRFISYTDDIYGLDFDKLEREAMSWFRNLPVEYQKELEGIAIGSSCSIEKLGQWYYCDRCFDGGCTSFITEIDGDFWLGRNNDYIFPEFWGYITILEVDNKIPVMLFGLEGSTFSGTGYNAEKLWIHYNWLPVWDIPPRSQDVLAPFVFLRLALESCKTIDEVEQLLRMTSRDGGMNLFVVDGKTNQAAVFEATCQHYRRRDMQNGDIAAANHYCKVKLPEGLEYDFSGSMARQTRVETLLAGKDKITIPDSLIKILADPAVEQDSKYSGTVYSNIVCPAKDQMWYAHNGYPAASQSDWEKVNWKW